MRKLKAKAAGGPSTPKKGGSGGRSKATATPKTGATPKSGKRGASADTPDATPSKRSKKVGKPAEEGDDDEEFGTFNVKKEEVADVNASADSFYQTANAYAHGEL